MSLDSPLWELQESLYTRLDTGVTLASVYDFLPDDVSYPYIFLEEESVSGVEDKSGASQRVDARVMVFSLQPDSKEMKDVVAEIFASMEAKLVLSSWTTIHQLLVPNMRTYRAETKTGARGRAADLTFQFLFQQ